LALYKWTYSFIHCKLQYLSRYTIRSVLCFTDQLFLSFFRLDPITSGGPENGEPSLGKSQNVGNLGSNNAELKIQSQQVENRNEGPETVGPYTIL